MSFCVAMPFLLNSMFNSEGNIGQRARVYLLTRQALFIVDEGILNKRTIYSVVTKKKWATLEDLLRMSYC